MASEFADLAKTFSAHRGVTVQNLKDELKLNKQAQSGTRLELLGRVIDGRVRGALKLCPTCARGRLRAGDFQRTVCQEVDGVKDYGDGAHCPGSYDAVAERQVRCAYAAVNAIASRLRDSWRET
jgi:hypothetical protein